MKKRIKLYASHNLEPAEQNPLAFETWLELAPRMTYQFALCIKSIHWFIQGPDFKTTHEYLDELFENAVNDADFYGELAVELGVMPNSLTNNEGGCLLEVPSSLISVGAGLQTAANLIEFYIGSLLEVYPTICSTDITGEFDSIIRYWRKARDFFIKSTLGGVTQ